MKKVFYVINIFIIISVLASSICNLIFSKPWLITLGLVLISLLAIINFVYIILYRNKKVILPAGLTALGVVCACISYVFFYSNVTLFYVLLIISIALIISSIVVGSKLNLNIIAYVLITIIPCVVVVNLPYLFGYANALNRVMASILIAVSAGLFGSAIEKLIRRQSTYNIVLFFSSLLNLLVSFVLIIIKQSNVTFRLDPIAYLVLAINFLSFAVLTLLTNKDSSFNKIKTKNNVIYSICIFLVMLLAGWSFYSNFYSFNLISAKVFKEEFLNRVKDDLDIPIIEIYTQQNELPTSKEEYVNCSFKISNCEDESFNFSVPMAKNYDDENSVGIRLRGNSTKKAKKRPYRIKFENKKSLLDLKENKSWVLLADYYDQSNMRNYTAFTIADKFDNLNFTPTPNHVALIINNEFKGLYLLCEQIDEKKGRTGVDKDFDISVDKEFPFLIEMDAKAYLEGVTGVDNFYVPDADNHVEIKYPEADERFASADSDAVYDYITEYVNAVFKTIKTNQKVEVSFRENPVGLEDLVDIDSAVDYYLVNEIMLNADSVWKSIYFHKTKDGLMEFGPVWDFDYSMSTFFEVPYKKSFIESSNQLYVAKASMWKSLLSNEEFYNRVSARFNAKSSELLSTIEYIKNYKSTIDEVALIDARMWYGATGEFQYDMQYDYVCYYLMERFDFLNDAFNRSHSEFLNLV